MPSVQAASTPPPASSPSSFAARLSSFRPKISTPSSLARLSPTKRHASLDSSPPAAPRSRPMTRSQTMAARKAGTASSAVPSAPSDGLAKEKSKGGAAGRRTVSSTSQVSDVSKSPTVTTGALPRSPSKIPSATVGGSGVRAGMSATSSRIKSAVGGSKLTRSTARGGVSAGWIKGAEEAAGVDELGRRLSSAMKSRDDAARSQSRASSDVSEIPSRAITPAKPSSKAPTILRSKTSSQFNSSIPVVKGTTVMKKAPSNTRLCKSASMLADSTRSTSGKGTVPREGMLTAGRNAGERRLSGLDPPGEELVEGPQDDTSLDNDVCGKGNEDNRSLVSVKSTRSSGPSKAKGSEEEPERTALGLSAGRNRNSILVPGPAPASLRRGSKMSAESVASTTAGTEASSSITFLDPNRLNHPAVVLTPEKSLGKHSALGSSIPTKKKQAKGAKLAADPPAAKPGANGLASKEPSSALPTSGQSKVGAAKKVQSVANGSKKRGKTVIEGGGPIGGQYTRNEGRAGLGSSLSSRSLIRKDSVDQLLFTSLQAMAVKAGVPLQRVQSMMQEAANKEGQEDDDAASTTSALLNMSVDASMSYLGSPSSMGPGSPHSLPAEPDELTSPALRAQLGLRSPQKTLASSLLASPALSAIDAGEGKRSLAFLDDLVAPSPSSGGPSNLLTDDALQDLQREMDKAAGTLLEHWPGHTKARVSDTALSPVSPSGLGPVKPEGLNLTTAAAAEDNGKAPRKSASSFSPPVSPPLSSVSLQSSGHRRGGNSFSSVWAPGSSSVAPVAALELENELAQLRRTTEAARRADAEAVAEAEKRFDEEKEGKEKAILRVKELEKQVEWLKEQREITVEELDRLETRQTEMKDEVLRLEQTGREAEAGYKKDLDELRSAMEGARREAELEMQELELTRRLDLGVTAWTSARRASQVEYDTILDGQDLCRGILADLDVFEHYLAITLGNGVVTSV